jgi:hypothetical protein
MLSLVCLKKVVTPFIFPPREEAGIEPETSDWRQNKRGCTVIMLIEKDLAD